MNQITNQKDDAMKVWGKWLIGHVLHWIVLYYAFAVGIDGAMYVLKFFVWVLALCSLALLNDKILAEAGKLEPKPVRRALNSLQAWVTLGLLVWFGHIVSAIAWGVLMLMVAVHHDAVSKARSTGDTTA